jgi:NAD(P)-dependent dehydrogenase (short-subunit alcohol dehydrogenase family)
VIVTDGPADRAAVGAHRKTDEFPRAPTSYPVEHQRPTNSEADMTQLLEGKTAIIYGGGGGIGAGVARSFAREGAKVFLVGRTRETLDAVAREITSAGGSAEVAVLDALDELAVDAHVRDVVAGAGSLDVSFNLVTRGDVQGTPLVEMEADDLLRAVVAGLRSNFLTARAAARRMIEQGSGVILHLNSASAAAAMPGMGSTGPADAATEAFMRYLAAELGPHGVRVCGIWTAGVAETLSREKLVEVAGDNAPTPEAAVEMIAGMAALRRAPRLADVAEVAAFLASDRAAGMTGSMANVTSGLVLR